MTVDVLGPIVVDIKAKLDVAVTTVKGYGVDQWQGDSANDIAVSLDALIVVRYFIAAYIQTSVLLTKHTMK